MFEEDAPLMYQLFRAFRFPAQVDAIIMGTGDDFRAEAGAETIQCTRPPLCFCCAELVSMQEDRAWKKARIYTR